MSNKTAPRTVREATRELAENLVLRQPDDAIDTLAALFETSLCLGMKAEWDMEDNFCTTEQVAFLATPDLTDDEVVEAAAHFDLDADNLDEPWIDAHDRAMEAREGDGEDG